jgi:hypothetical protein
MTIFGRGGDMGNDAMVNGRLDEVAAKLIIRGLHVRVPVDVPLSPDNPDANSIWVHNPASGKYAQVSYVSSGLDSGGACLELTYQTAPDEDPDGAEMADRVVRLLSAGFLTKPDPRAYKKLAALLRDQITGGVLTPGEPLPPIGELRRKHGHSRQTVGKAMKVMSDEGLIYWVPGLGYYVTNEEE